MKVRNLSTIIKQIKDPLIKYRNLSIKIDPVTQRNSVLMKICWALNIVTGAVGIFFGYQVHQTLSRNELSKCPRIKNEKPVVSCPFKEFSSLAPILENANAAVVCIRFIKNNVLVSEQSGFIVDNTGLTMTVGVDPSQFDHISIKTSDGRTFPASLVEYDTSTMLCMLKVHLNYPVSFNFLSLLSKEDIPIKVGDFIVTLGTSGSNVYNQFSFGVIKFCKQDDDFKKQEYLSYVAVEGRFNSGGPVLNLKGKVIGINLTQSSGNEKCQVFVPIECGRPLLERIKQSYQIGCFQETHQPAYSSSESKLIDHRKDCFFR